MKPNFFILGAAKCGSSSLYRYLDQHPDIAFSTPKEPIFFEAEYEKGLDYYTATYFPNWNGEQRIGEARHRNLYLPYVPQRLYDSYPEAKLIVILRNPIERAFSDWLMRRRSGHESLDFDAAISSDLKRIEEGMDFSNPESARSWQEHILLMRQFKGKAPSLGEKLPPYRFRTYLDSGYYAQQIERYLALFPRRQLKIVLLEDLSAKPQQIVSDIWRFLEIDSGITLGDRSASNVGGKLATQNSRRRLRALLGDRLLAKIPANIKQAAKSLFDRLAPDNPEISPATRAFLVSHFAAHNRALEALIDRDLSHWDQ